MGEGITPNQLTGVPIYSSDDLPGGPRILTDAQIKALPTTPIEIVPAPGPGKILYPVCIIYHMNWVADYTNIDAGSQLKHFMQLLMPFRQDTSSNVSALLAGGGPDGTNGIAYPTINGRVDAAPGSVITSAFGGNYDSDIVNVAATVWIDNQGAGNLTGGDPGNSLKVTALYTIYSIS